MYWSTTPLAACPVTLRAIFFRAAPLTGYGRQRRGLRWQKRVPGGCKRLLGRLVVGTPNLEKLGGYRFMRLDQAPPYQFAPSNRFDCDPD